MNKDGKQRQYRVVTHERVRRVYLVDGTSMADVRSRFMDGDAPWVGGDDTAAILQEEGLRGGHVKTIRWDR